MSLKRFSDFSKTISNKETPKVIKESGVVFTKPRLEKKVIKEEEKLDKSLKNESFDKLFPIKEQKSKIIFEGCVAEFTNCLAVEAYKILEKKNISKEDVRYFIAEKNNNISVVRYDENVGINLIEFAKTLISYYKKQPALTEIVNSVGIRGNDKFVIIENIKDKKMTSIIKHDLKKLLSNKNLK